MVKRFIFYEVLMRQWHNIILKILFLSLWCAWDIMAQRSGDLNKLYNYVSCVVVSCVVLPLPSLDVVRARGW